MVRGRILLGNWWHLAGRAHAESALWVPRLAVYQFFHLALRHHRGRCFPDVDPWIPTISDIDCAGMVMVGVLFCGHVRCGRADWFQLRISAAQAGGVFDFKFSLRFAPVVPFTNAWSGAALFSRTIRTVCHFRFCEEKIAMEHSKAGANPLNLVRSGFP